jgi:hypothetical protein
MGMEATNRFHFYETISILPGYVDTCQQGREGEISAFRNDQKLQLRAWELQPNVMLTNKKRKLYL